MGWICRRLTLWSLAFAFAFVPAGAAADVTRDQIVSHWKAYWAAIENVEVECDEFVVRDGALEKDPSFPLMQYSLVLGSRARRAIRGTATNSDGTRWRPFDVREDGRQTCDIEPFRDDLDSTNVLVLRPQSSTSSVYQGPMCAWLWLMRPGGKTLEGLLAGGGSLELSRGSKEVRLVFDHKGARKTCELDPDHDWLPGRLRMPDGMVLCEATRFTRERGLYFPVEGIQAMPPSGQKQKLMMRIHVNRIQLNAPLPASRFLAPAPPPGTLIHDEIRKTSWYQGGDEARLKAEKLHHVDSKSATNAAKVTASVDPPASPWFRPLVAFAVGSFAVALFLRVRSYRAGRATA